MKLKILTFALLSAVATSSIAEIHITATSGIGINVDTKQPTMPASLQFKGEFELGEVGLGLPDLGWLKFSSGPLAGYGIVVADGYGFSIQKTSKKFDAKLGSDNVGNIFWEVRGVIDSVNVGVSKNFRSDIFNVQPHRTKIFVGDWIHLGYGPFEVHLSDLGGKVVSWKSDKNTLALGKYKEGNSWSSSSIDAQALKFTRQVTDQSKLVYTYSKNTGSAQNELTYIVDFELFRR